MRLGFVAFLVMIVMAVVLVRAHDGRRPGQALPDAEPTGADADLPVEGDVYAIRCLTIPCTGGQRRTRATMATARHRGRPRQGAPAPGPTVRRSAEAWDGACVGHTLTPRPRPAPAQEPVAARRRAPVALGVSTFTVALLCAATIPVAVGQVSPDQEFCPRRQSVTISDGGNTLQAWLVHSVRGTLVHLCWSGAADTGNVVNRWAATAQVATTDDRTRVDVVPLTDRTALGSVYLDPGRVWTLSFEVHTVAGAHPVLSTAVTR
ncbi:hypothetical protein KIF24_31305 [Micromonospora sp. Llam7]|uniref:hypothetical protein n=1 Tax=Micromonospora tarapacensis TaxID=2835305 RepID=UPI001C837F69|nr:hypothetical protein [Micromonospora tarapacensis]MBX7270069.1 hypothetical protein [Micromonospora tarapacensis]